MLVTMIIISALTAAPLAYNILFTPGFNDRAVALLVFQTGRPVINSIRLWGQNTFALFNPTFLFITGDEIYRHSLPIFGMLGTINLIPLVYLFTARFKDSWNKFNWFLLVVIFMTCVSTGLTNDYAPHGLRSCLCFLPYSILIGEGWHYILCGRKKAEQIIWGLIFILCFILYFAFYCLIGEGMINF